MANMEKTDVEFKIVIWDYEDGTYFVDSRLAFRSLAEAYEEYLHVDREWEVGAAVFCLKDKEVVASFGYTSDHPDTKIQIIAWEETPRPSGVTWISPCH